MSTSQSRLLLPVLGVWCGLVTGTVALVVQAGLLSFAHLSSPSPLGLEVGWLNAPLVDAVFFGGVGLALYCAFLFLPGRASWRGAAFTLSFLVFLSLLFLIPGIALYSVLLLAGGAAFQASRVMETRQTAMARVCRQTLPWLLLLAVGSALWNFGAPLVT